MESIKQKLIKIRNLYENAGTDGEREAAENMLVSLLARHGMSEEDLRALKLEPVIIAYRTKEEKILIMQLWGKMINFDFDERPIFKSNGTTKLEIEMTKLEKAEFLMQYDLLLKDYRREYAKMKKTFNYAFMDKNDFLREAGAEASEHDEDDELDMNTLGAMFMAIKRTHIPRAMIEGNGHE